ncbi:hypothetical protein [Polaromonas sp. JS666]|uniref:hypothetical protein n=1 Tax=Polaromonas sp. (strain JS666 / ATCC BAA-500) TaxID=296591 RepID=UPI000892371C|nr:hypothetical protein [Polaromonas sp. JS666]SDN27830.1 hypothetical protein SAMN05720382_104269 [Polaromonas sp. JS666]
MPNSVSTPAKFTLTLSAAGVLLHVYTAVFRADGGLSWFLLGLVLLSCLPYGIAAALTRARRAHLLALGWAIASLLADLYMHYSVFVAPKGSTAALGLLFMPIWNLLVIGPAGAVAVWGCHRLFAAGRRTA